MGRAKLSCRVSISPAASRTAPTGPAGRRHNDKAYLFAPARRRSTVADTLRQPRRRHRGARRFLSDWSDCQMLRRIASPFARSSLCRPGRVAGGQRSYRPPPPRRSPERLRKPLRTGEVAPAIFSSPIFRASRWPAPEGAFCCEELPATLKSVRENWVVPPGLGSFFPLFPALKRWAKFVRPSGAVILELFVPPDRQNVSSHAHTEALG